jgi:hypothetical protein
VIDFLKVCPPTDDATVEEMMKISAEYERIKDNEGWEWDLFLFIGQLGLSINQVRRSLDLPVVD